MTIDEAIKALRQDLDDPGSVDYDWRAKAQELGIEALKRIREERVYHFSQGLIGINRLLRGETEK